MNRALPLAAGALISAVVLLLAGAAFGQSTARGRPESVIIEGKNILTGIWRFPSFSRVAALQAGGAVWSTPGPDVYCRIETVVFTFDCFDLPMKEGHATLNDDGNVRLSWQGCNNGDGCGWRTYWVFTGRLKSRTQISGHVGTVSGGRLYEQPERLTITKQILSDRSSDPGGQREYLKLLLNEMANGDVTEPYARPNLFSSNPEFVPLSAEQQAKMMAFLAPDTLHRLGKMIAVIYVGDYRPVVGWNLHYVPVHSSQRASIYSVEFEDGERLCALHRRADGVLDQFQCI